MARHEIEVACGILFTISSLHAQQAPDVDTTNMPAKEAYTYAITPFLQARQAPNDLTDADKWALGIANLRAREACASLSKKLQDDETLLDQGKLCLLGRDYLNAAEALRRYVSLEKPANLADGRLMLVQAYIGAHDLGQAEAQINLLLEDFPYDAKIHIAIDNTIEAAEADQNYRPVALRMNEAQSSRIFDALESSGTLLSADKSETVTASMLVQDALRDARIYREEKSQAQADKLLQSVKKLVASPRFADTAELPIMQAALDRYLMIGHKALEVKLRGEKILSTGAVKQIIDLQNSNCILIPFSLAAPSSTDVIVNVANRLKSKTPLPVYAITSFMANQGSEERSAEVLATLKMFRAQLPSNVTVLLVPDVEIQMFNIDSYPSGIALSKDGTVRFAEPLAGRSGAVRRLVSAFEN